jgi:hypothetical protein
MAMSKQTIDRINKLQGNQARIMLLHIFHQGLLDEVEYYKIMESFEVAESYSPQSELKSF